MVLLEQRLKPALAALPPRPALGLHQYKAPPPGARRAQGAATAATGFSGDADPLPDEDFLAPSAPPAADSDDPDFISPDAEASAMADARERGEESLISAALTQAEEDTASKKLPTVTELLPQIPPAIQEALDDIFRARWTKVVRVKKRDLFKS